MLLGKGRILLSDDTSRAVGAGLACPSASCGDAEDFAGQNKVKKNVLQRPVWLSVPSKIRMSESE
jgi:hypothetical protein